MPPLPTDETTAPVQPSAPAPQRWTGVTPRAWIISLVLIPLVVFWVEYNEIVAQGSELAAMSLTMAAVFPLLLLVAVNLLLKKWRPQWALMQSELMFIYCLTTVAAYISGIGMIQFLNPTLVGWRHFATPTNHWGNWQFLVPRWAVPPADVVEGYYLGHSSFFTPRNAAAWAGPICLWTLFILTLMTAMYCVSSLLRKQWVENERLAFPIVIVPLAITQDGGQVPLWKSRPLWVGVALPVIIESVNTIHFTMAPTLPYFSIKVDEARNLANFITTPPWNATGNIFITFFPLVIGLTFLLSQDVSFSCWFFYLLTKVERLFAAANGLPTTRSEAQMSIPPYTAEQGLGAFLGLALMSLWLARRHLRATWSRAFCGDTTVDDSHEPLSYRTAWVMLAASTLLLILFGIALGLSPLLSVLFFALYLLFALGMTRIRAEAGLAWGPGSSSGWPGVHSLITAIGGTQSLTQTDATAMAFLHWSDTDWRCLEQPAQMESLKIAAMVEPRPLSPRQMTAGIAAAAVIGSIAAWISCLGIYYHYGAGSAIVEPWRTQQGRFPFDQLQSLITTTQPPRSSSLIALLVGLGVAVALSALRTRWVWLPLHPIGYAAANTDIMAWIWFPVLIGWLCKLLVLKYGGIRAYRQALPFFIGLILGDYGISGLWSVAFMISGHPGYRTFPT